ncbi:MAG: MBL fold metallo-hydrolase [Sphaerochaeta sp.]|nr:MBL fold metallo-hydrolase [Sphaerochaeta sp.]
MDIQVLASSSRGNCYRITDGSTPLLLEAGIRLKDIQQKLNFRLSEIAGCLITHEHQDHCKAVQDIMKAGIDCYMSQGTAEAIGALGHRGHRVKITKSLEQFRIGTWTILPFDTVHDAKEPLGFLMASGTEKLLFATDTAYLRYKFRGLTHIMVEANHQAEILQNSVEEDLIPAAVRKRIRRSHFDLNHLKEFFKANDLSELREVWLLHLSENNSDEGQFKREIQEIVGKPVYVA